VTLGERQPRRLVGERVVHRGGLWRNLVREALRNYSAWIAPLPVSIR
jgi:hypothetical protein